MNIEKNTYSSVKKLTCFGKKQHSKIMGCCFFVYLRYKMEKRNMVEMEK